MKQKNIKIDAPAHALLKRVATRQGRVISSLATEYITTCAKAAKKLSLPVPGVTRSVKTQSVGVASKTMRRGEGKP